MKWNYDFELAALTFEIILIIFYFAKRHLPTNKNKYFILCMCVGCGMTFMDLVTAIVNMQWLSFPYEIVQLLNIIYFLSTSLNTVFLFMYILALTGQLDMTRSPLFIIYCIPSAVAMIIVLSTPFTGAIYYFDSIQGYMHGPTYYANYVLNSFYLILATIYIVVYRKAVRKIQFFSVIGMILLLSAGVILQSLFFNWVLLTNAFLCLAMSVMYLSSQNPDLYIDKETTLFNRDGFMEYLEELTATNSRFTCLVICLDNYKTIVSVFGEDKAKGVLNEIISYVKKTYSDKHVFRYNEDTYIVLTPVEFDVATAMEEGRKKLDGGFYYKGEQIKLSVRFIVLSDEQTGNDALLTLDVINFAQKRVSLGVTRDIIVDEEFVRKSQRSRDVESAVGRAIERNAVQI
nr:diguanylate cyclase [Lachnospiraceae bacterium]